jgi:hypothetical protein
MSIPIMTETSLKAAVSVAQMCRLFRPPMSRSQFYWHVKRGTFHAPLYLPSNNRPYFTATMVQDNLRAREVGVGVNGEFVIFYERQATGMKTEGKKLKASHHSTLLDGLKASGLKEVTGEQVEAALTACFPNGTNGQDDNTVLRAVFRLLKRSGTG